MTGTLTTFSKSNDLVHVVPAEIQDYMYKLAWVTVIIILKICGLKLVFAACARELLEWCLLVGRAYWVLLGFWVFSW